MSDLRAELAAAVDQAEWEWLLPHVERDAVVMVVPALDLVEVGMAIVNDRTATVTAWIADSQLYKPSPAQQAAWQADPRKRFTALIVQPYVLVQDVPA
jgi:hypothetical protein